MVLRAAAVALRDQMIHVYGAPIRSGSTLKPDYTGIYGAPDCSGGPQGADDTGI